MLRLFPFHDTTQYQHCFAMVYNIALYTSAIHASRHCRYVFTKWFHSRLLVHRQKIQEVISVVFCTNHRGCIAISACNAIVRMRPQGNVCTVSVCDRTQSNTTISNNNVAFFFCKFQFF